MVSKSIRRFKYKPSDRKTEIIKKDLESVKYLFLNKTNFIIEKSEKNSEKFVKDYFEEKGYVILRPKKLKLNSIKYKVAIELLFYFFESNERKLEDFLDTLNDNGRPDFLVFNECHFFFIEVKSDGGSSIQKNQIQFLEHLNELKIPNFIFLVHNQEPLKQEQENE